MAQHSIMSILLFVCLCLCFGVAQSQLKPLRGPCVKSTQCQSKCCFRSSPQGSGECVIRISQKDTCYGPEIGDRCYNSNECDNGCCRYILSPTRGTCARRDSRLTCNGPNDGDTCYSSADCNSGCCTRSKRVRTLAECRPKPQAQGCFGPNNGDLCSLSAECDSGCCRKSVSRDGIDMSRCQSKSAENATCSPVSINGKYDSCPCEGGLTCQLDRNTRYFCKKPGTANN